MQFTTLLAFSDGAEGGTSLGGEAGRLRPAGGKEGFFDLLNTGWMEGEKTAAGVLISKSTDTFPDVRLPEGAPDAPFREQRSDVDLLREMGIDEFEEAPLGELVAGSDTETGESNFFTSDLVVQSGGNPVVSPNIAPSDSEPANGVRPASEKETLKEASQGRSIPPDPSGSDLPVGKTGALNTDSTVGVTTGAVDVDRSQTTHSDSPEIDRPGRGSASLGSAVSDLAPPIWAVDAQTANGRQQSDVQPSPTTPAVINSGAESGVSDTVLQSFAKAVDASRTGLTDQVLRRAMPTQRADPVAPVPGQVPQAGVASNSLEAISRPSRDGHVPSGRASPAAEHLVISRARTVPANEMAFAAPQSKPGVDLSAALDMRSLRESPISAVDLSSELSAPGRDGPGQPTFGVASRPELAASRSIITQVVQTISRAQGEGVIEIRLQPEELGRVRLSITPGEAGTSIQLTVERPETLDLIRRNIDMLEKDLLGQGFENLEFSFDSEGADDEPPLGEDTDGSSRQPNDAPDHQLQLNLSDVAGRALSGHLDMRV